MPESLSQQRISDQYTSLLHISGGSIASWDRREAGDHPAGRAIASADQTHAGTDRCVPPDFLSLV